MVGKEIDGIEWDGIKWNRMGSNVMECERKGK